VCFVVIFETSEWQDGETDGDDRIGAGVVHVRDEPDDEFLQVPNLSGHIATATTATTTVHCAIDTSSSGVTSAGVSTSHL